MGIGAAASVGGGYLASSGTNKRTRTQKKNQRTIDDILAGIQGEGPYANLYQMDENAFQKSYVEPAKAMFENQIAPQIQQSYIANGMQGNTGMQDTLTRAGVDLDQLLNSAYMDYMQNALNRKQSGINQVLNADVGGQKMSQSDRWNQALGGYLTEQGGQMAAQNIGKYGQHMAQYHSFRPGFAGGGY